MRKILGTKSWDSIAHGTVRIEANTHISQSDHGVRLHPGARVSRRGHAVVGAAHKSGHPAHDGPVAVAPYGPDARYSRLGATWRTRLSVLAAGARALWALFPLLSLRHLSASAPCPDPRSAPRGVCEPRKSWRGFFSGFGSLRLANPSALPFGFAGSRGALCLLVPLNV